MMRTAEEAFAAMCDAKKAIDWRYGDVSYAHACKREYQTHTLLALKKACRELEDAADFLLTEKWLQEQANV